MLTLEADDPTRAYMKTCLKKMLYRFSLTTWKQGFLFKGGVLFEPWMRGKLLWSVTEVLFQTSL